MEFFNNQLMNISSLIIGIAGFFVAIFQIVKAGKVSTIVRTWGNQTILKIENLNKELEDLDHKISKIDGPEWRNKSHEIQAKVHSWANKTDEISNDLKVIFEFIKTAKKTELVDKGDEI